MTALLFLLVVFALSPVALAAPGLASPADTIDAYLMADEGEELALAMSAAPAHVAQDATVWVLRREGYEVVHEGTNGFNCLVARSFAGPARAFDPRSRAPMCFSPPATDSALAVVLEITEGVAAGLSRDEVLMQLNAALAAGRVRMPAPGSMAYMLSGEQWLNERVQEWLPHVMFFMPNVTNRDMGGNGFGDPWPFVLGSTTGAFGDVTVPMDPEDFLPVRRLDRTALDHPSRPSEDRRQDPHRKAVALYEWLGLRPGMAVADVFAAGGYNTHLLSLLMGSEGSVYSVLGSIAPAIRERAGIDSRKRVLERIEAGNLTNVRITETLGALPDEALDAIVSIRNFHDIDFFGGDSRAALEQMLRALKPGGVVGVEEMDTHHEGWHEETHRLGAGVVKRAFVDAGFEYAGRSELLHDPEDDHTIAGFDVGRHTLDRYVLKFHKPGR